MKGREEVRISESQEAEATRQAQRGDTNAFELLYRLHSSRVFALCLRTLKNTAEAEDLTQETFLTVFRGIRTFRGHSAFSSWLHRVTMNCVLIHLRRKPSPRPHLKKSSEAVSNPAIPERSCVTRIAGEAMTVGKTHPSHFGARCTLRAFNCRVEACSQRPGRNIAQRSPR